MKLLFLHGPPAAGKFTIAKELEEKISAKVFHNHLTIDVVKSLFRFGSEEFWSLVHDLRFHCLESAVKHCAGVVIYTGCYDHPVDLGFFEKVEHMVHIAGAELVPVYLQCKLETLEKRISNESRIKMGKLQSVEGLRNTLKNWNCISVPRESCVTIVTHDKTPAECAQEIITVLKTNKPKP